MRSVAMPPTVKNYMKCVPSAVIFFYLAAAHPLMLYAQVFHGKERIERQYFRRTRFEQFATKHDEALRRYWKPALDW